jgi:hypothetical protein
VAGVVVSGNGINRNLDDALKVDSTTARATGSVFWEVRIARYPEVTIPRVPITTFQGSQSAP